MIKLKKKILSCRSKIFVRFSEVDSLGIVWHGNYIKYFEDGREAFGKQFQFTYWDVFEKGYITPIVKTLCEYKKPLMYGDTAIIETTFVDMAAAKLIFEYKMYRECNDELIATGSTTQIFLDSNKQLMLTVPPFFEKWKKKNGLR